MLCIVSVCSLRCATAVRVHLTEFTYVFACGARLLPTMREMPGTTNDARYPENMNFVAFGILCSVDWRLPIESLHQTSREIRSISCLPKASLRFRENYEIDQNFEISPRNSMLLGPCHPYTFQFFPTFILPGELSYILS